MTELESKSYALMRKSISNTNTQSIHQSLSNESTINTAEETISTLTDDAGMYMNYQPKYLKTVPDTVTIGSKLNFATRRSAAVIETLLHDADLQKVREVNKTKAG